MNPATARLTKHHGLANDFLVLVDDTGRVGDDDGPLLARRWCDRRTGVGADGLLVLDAGPHADTAAGPDALRMRLWNADGSRAEISGNGIRCAVQAWVEARRLGLPATVTVHTDAGIRVVTATADPTIAPGGSGIQATVAMGPVRPIPAPARFDALVEALGAAYRGRAEHLSLGNPHTVVEVADTASVDLAALGAIVPEVNLEVVAAGPDPGGVTMRVHERGAGITMACGSGACAAAAAAERWGLTDPGAATVVHMDGGDATVRILDGAAVLTGPSVRIAAVEVTWPDALTTTGEGRPA